jgi:hypothetical protein
MDIVRVLMIKTEKGSMDGVTVLEFEKGVEYDLNSDLAEVFVDELEVATIVEDDEPDPDDPDETDPDETGDEVSGD